MALFPVFLSVVFVIRNQSAHLEKILSDATAYLATLVSDYELIVIDNASDDESVSVLKMLTRENGLPNLQVYALTKEVDMDTASWVGLESALGDFVAVVNPLAEDIEFLLEMLNKAIDGAEVVFARNQQKPTQSLTYRAAYAAFNWLYKRFHGIYLTKEAPQYRLFSKKVIHFILQHPQPALAYRHLPVTGGFARTNLNYSAKPTASYTKQLKGSIDRGIRLLVSTTRAPIRLATLLCLFGATANLVYSVYVIVVVLVKPGITPGWASISLQQSGMFFLISLVLLVLGEYIIQMAGLSNEGPAYHVSQEFTSAHMTRHGKLNVEEAATGPADFSRTWKHTSG